MMSGASQTLNLVDRPGSASALFHPLRRRILQALREPDSATGLGRRLGLPRQKLNYHLKELEKASLVEVVEERRKGNCIERVLRARADTFVIDPSALGALAADPRGIGDRFSISYLVALAARAIQDLAVLTQRARKLGRKIATLSLETEIRFDSAASRNAFAGELAAEVARLAEKYHRADAPEGRTFRLFVGAHPEVHLGERPTPRGAGEPGNRSEQERSDDDGL